MTKVVGKITFDPKPVKVGAQWQVVASHSNERQEHLTGFRSEADAKHWITNGSKAWLKKRPWPTARAIAVVATAGVQVTPTSRHQSRP